MPQRVTVGAADPVIDSRVVPLGRVEPTLDLGCEIRRRRPERPASTFGTAKDPAFPASWCCDYVVEVVARIRRSVVGRLGRWRQGQGPSRRRRTRAGRRTAEVERSSVWVRCRSNVVPVQDVLAQVRMPARRRRRQGRRLVAIRGREGEGEEGGVRVAGVTGPPAHLDLLGVRRVAHDEVVGRRVDGATREEADGEVEGPPPGVDRRRTPAIRSAQRGEHERRLSRRCEVGGDLRGIVGAVLVVLVERHCPRSLLRCRVDPHRADEVAHGGQQLACHVGDGAIGGQRDAVRSTVGVLGDGVVAVEVQRDDQCAGAVGRRQRQGLPPAPAQAQRGVLQLRLRRGQHRRELAEDLRVGVHGVAGRAPRLVGKRQPSRRH